MTRQRTLATVAQRNRPSNNLHLCVGGTGRYKPNKVSGCVNGVTLAPHQTVVSARTGLPRLVPLNRHHYFKPFSDIAM